ncbi:MAG: restriction endonuclease subunit S [Synechococcaceae cyanobacterium]
MLFDIIPDRWRSTTLGEICEEGGGDIQTGPFGSQLHASDYVEDGIPSIMPANIRDGRVSEECIARITIFDAERLSRYLVREGDLVYSRRGDVERCALIRNHQSGWLCGTGCLRVRPGIGVIESDFCAHFLSHPETKEWVSRHAVGATMPNLNTQILSAVPILLPPLEEQKAIAHILGTLDDKIELNRKTNETLEAMAKALFQSWFVDFDPVRAKAECRPTGLPDQVSDLFPDSFEESELGEIPRGWGVQALDGIAHFLNGLALQKFPPEDGIPTLPVIKIAQLKKGDALGADRCSASLPEDYVIRDGDVLFSWSGSLAVDIWCGGDGALNQHLFKVTSKTYGKWFIYQWVKHHLPGFQEIAQGKATTMGHIQRHHLSEAKAMIPMPSLLGAMDSVFAPLLERSLRLRWQSRELSAARDTLLPKLISGELRIPEAEKLLEQAGV